MCHCVCVPKKSRKTKRCPECYPNREKPKGHDPKRIVEQKQRNAGGKKLGEILLAVEKHPSEPIEE